MSAPARRRARKDRRERRNASTAIRRLPWRTVRNPHPPTRILSEDQIEAIHHASLRVLRDVGMKVLSPKARALYVGAGASADEHTAMVRFDPRDGRGAEWPRRRPRTPSRRATPRSRPSSGATSSTSGWSAAVLRLRPRPRATRRDYEDFPQLHEAVRLLRRHPPGRGVAPRAPGPAGRDPPPGHVLRAITLHDKVWGASLLGGYRAHDAVEMACHRARLTRGELPAQPIVSGGINTNSPRQLDANMSDG